MKKIIVVLALIFFPLAGCNDNQAITDAVNSTAEQVTGNGGGLDMGDVAVGALGGAVLGNMLGGGSHNTTIIKEKKVYRPYTSTPSRPYSSRLTSFSSSRRR